MLMFRQNEVHINLYLNHVTMFLNLIITQKKTKVNVTSDNETYNENNVSANGFVINANDDLNVNNNVYSVSEKFGNTQIK